MTHRSRDSRESLQRLVAEVMDHANPRARAPARKRVDVGKRRSQLLIVLLCWFVGVFAWRLQGSTAPPSVLTPAEQETGIRFSIFLAVETVERYRSENGVLPQDLGMVGIQQEELSYELSEGRYRLTGTLGDLQVVYDEGDDIAPFREAHGVLMRRGGQ